MPAHTEDSFNDQTSMINETNPRIAYDILNSSSSDGDDVISKFYEDSTVFITGSTGFVGKLLIEKLLRDFLIKRIYLLVRAKDKTNIETRLKQLCEDEVFDRLREERPNALKRVKVIEANFAAQDLGISEENRELLRNEVNIVFNVVASVKFNEKLRDAVEINILGTQRTLHLTKQMKNLKAFLHVSTFFSNCDRKEIDEKFYSSDISYEKMIQLTELLNDTYLDKIQQALCGTKPNTYTLTKSYSEHLVQKEANGIPTGIFRPPILIGTYKEPFAGWTDNLYGPTGLSLGLVRNYIHVLFADPDCKANVAPADYCVNAMLSAAWDINRRFKSSMENHTDIPIYNYVCEENTITWGKFFNLIQNGMQSSLRKIIWNCTSKMTPSTPLFNVANMVFHCLPAFIMDCFAIIIGRKRINMKNFEKLNQVLMMMSFFGKREWKFSNKNVDEMVNLLKLQSKEQRNESMMSNDHRPNSDLKNDSISKNHVNSKEVRHRSLEKNKAKSTSYLEFDLRTIDWNEYFRHYLPGIERYCLKNQKRKDELKKAKILNTLM